jgi:predicted DNA-binding protein (UPF0251 family)
MPRPRRFRRVRFQPTTTYFKPSGVRVVELEETILTVDEFESIRLKDLLGLDQEAAAKKMNISQPTFNRLISSARKKIADALVNGKAIRIEGGVFKMVQPRRFRGRFRGPAVSCKCIKCGNIEPKTRGIPCANLKCSKCGSPMIRGE